MNYFQILSSMPNEQNSLQLSLQDKRENICVDAFMCCKRKTKREPICLSTKIVSLNALVQKGVCNIPWALGRFNLINDWCDIRISLFCTGNTFNTCSDTLSRNTWSWPIVQISNFATSVIILSVIKSEMESLVSQRPRY
jgi:hypothetical protein